MQSMEEERMKNLIDQYTGGADTGSFYEESRSEPEAKASSLEDFLKAMDGNMDFMNSRLKQTATLMEHASEEIKNNITSHQKKMDDTASLMTEMLQKLQHVEDQLAIYSRRQKESQEAVNNLDLAALEDILQVNEEFSEKASKKKKEKVVGRDKHTPQELICQICSLPLTTAHIRLLTIAIRSPLLSMDELYALADARIGPVQLYEKIKLIAELKKM